MEIRPDSRSLHNPNFYKKINNPVYGIEMLKVLARSRLTFNGHINHTGHNSVNMRLFESTGMGCCLLTDKRNIIGDYFEENKEILTYKCNEDAIEKVKYIQSNPKKMQEIGSAAKKRTLRDHTVENQINTLTQALAKI